MTPSRTMFYVLALGFVLVFWSMQGAAAEPLAPITVVIFSVLIVSSVVAQVTQVFKKREDSTRVDEAASPYETVRFCSSCGAQAGRSNPPNRT